jgi:hypothetical protein
MSLSNYTIPKSLPHPLVSLFNSESTFSNTSWPHILLVETIIPPISQFVKIKLLILTVYLVCNSVNRGVYQLVKLTCRGGIICTSAVKGGQ